MIWTMKTTAIFNSCLDEPLNTWEMGGGLGTLKFLEFVYQIYHHGGPNVLEQEELPPQPQPQSSDDPFLETEEEKQPCLTPFCSRL